MKIPPVIFAIGFLGLPLSTSAQVSSLAAPEVDTPATTKLTGLVFARTPQRELKLDLQWPATTSEKPYPLLVWIHGGGWTEGHRGFSPLWPLTKEGYAVASISYRFVQEDIFPAQIVDVKTAIRWLRAHAAEYHLDPDHIGVAGESAGGHLAALLGLTPEKKAWESGDNLEYSSRVQAVVDLCGPADFTTGDPTEPSVASLLASGDKTKLQGASQIISREVTLSRLLGGSPRENPDKAKAASPITYVNASSPPFFFIHGDSDYLVPLSQSTRLVEALQKSGVPADIEIVKGAGHGFGRLPPALLEKVRAFFDSSLRRGE